MEEEKNIYLFTNKCNKTSKGLYNILLDYDKDNDFHILKQEFISVMDYLQIPFENRETILKISGFNKNMKLSINQIIAALYKLTATKKTVEDLYKEMAKKSNNKLISNNDLIQILNNFTIRDEDINSLISNWDYGDKPELFNIEDLIKHLKQRQIIINDVIDINNEIKFGETNLNDKDENSSINNKSKSEQNNKSITEHNENNNNNKDDEYQNEEFDDNNNNNNNNYTHYDLNTNLKKSDSNIIIEKSKTFNKKDNNQEEEDFNNYENYNEQEQDQEHEEYNNENEMMENNNENENIENNEEDNKEDNNYNDFDNNNNIEEINENEEGQNGENVEENVEENSNQNNLYDSIDNINNQNEEEEQEQQPSSKKKKKKSTSKKKKKGKKSKERLNINDPINGELKIQISNIENIILPKNVTSPCSLFLICSIEGIDTKLKSREVITEDLRDVTFNWATRVLLKKKMLSELSSKCNINLSLELKNKNISLGNCEFTWIKCLYKSNWDKFAINEYFQILTERNYKKEPMGNIKIMAKFIPFGSKNSNYNKFGKKKKTPTNLNGIAEEPSSHSFISKGNQSEIKDNQNNDNMENNQDEINNDENQIGEENGNNDDNEDNKGKQIIKEIDIEITSVDKKDELANKGYNLSVYAVEDGNEQEKMANSDLKNILESLPHTINLNVYSYKKNKKIIINFYVKDENNNEVGKLPIILSNLESHLEENGNFVLKTKNDNNEYEFFLKIAVNTTEDL